MGPREVIKSQIGTAEYLVEKFTGDLGDDDFLHQLPEGGQTVTWILGHLACTEDWTLHHLTGEPYQIAEDLHGKFKGGSTVETDPSANPSRTEIEGIYREQRARTLAALEQSDESEWDNAAPEGLPEVFPTVGSLWGMTATHVFWHVGQITVIRRLLGKPPIMGG